MKSQQLQFLPFFSCFFQSMLWKMQRTNTFFFLVTHKEPSFFSISKAVVEDERKISEYSISINFYRNSANFSEKESTLWRCADFIFCQICKQILTFVKFIRKSEVGMVRFDPWGKLTLRKLPLRKPRLLPLRKQSR